MFINDLEPNDCRLWIVSYRRVSPKVCKKFIETPPTYILQFFSNW